MNELERVIRAIGAPVLIVPAEATAQNTTVAPVSFAFPTRPALQIMLLLPMQSIPLDRERGDTRWCSKT